eukprot:1139180-Pelagomonas_calceolata.AAC.2
MLVRGVAGAERMGGLQRWNGGGQRTAERKLCALHVEAGTGYAFVCVTCVYVCGSVHSHAAVARTESVCPCAGAAAVVLRVLAAHRFSMRVRKSIQPCKFKAVLDLDRVCTGQCTQHKYKPRCPVTHRFCTSSLTRPLAYAAPAAYLAAAAATVATSAIRTWPAPVCTADEAAADIAPLQRVAADAVHAAPLCVAAAAAAAAAAVLPPVAVGCCKSSAAAVVAAYAAAVAAPQH